MNNKFNIVLASTLRSHFTFSPTNILRSSPFIYAPYMLLLLLLVLLLLLLLLLLLIIAIELSLVGSTPYNSTDKNKNKYT